MLLTKQVLLYACEPSDRENPDVSNPVTQTHVNHWTYRLVG
jgi:hypothetical protein